MRTVTTVEKTLECVLFDVDKLPDERRRGCLTALIEVNEHNGEWDGDVLHLSFDGETLYERTPGNGLTHEVFGDLQERLGALGFGDIYIETEVKLLVRSAIADSYAN